MPSTRAPGSVAAGAVAAAAVAAAPGGGTAGGGRRPALRRRGLRFRRRRWLLFHCQWHGGAIDGERGARDAGAEVLDAASSVSVRRRVGSSGRRGGRRPVALHAQRRSTLACARAARRALHERRRVRLLLQPLRPGLRTLSRRRALERRAPRRGRRSRRGPGRDHGGGQLLLVDARERRAAVERSRTRRGGVGHLFGGDFWRGFCLVCGGLVVRRFALKKRAAAPG